MSRRASKQDEATKAGVDPVAEESPSGAQRFREQAGTLILAVAIALLIRAVIIEPFRIPSGSMLPTLLIGDHLFVNKFIYGIRIPFTDVRLPGLREPRRGDVVVFNVGRDGERIVPADRRPDLPRDDFVKRIVGLPGDRVEVRNGQVFVNGEDVPQEALGRTFSGERGDILSIKREDLEGCAHQVLDDPYNQGLQQAPYAVEPGRYFMLGDNRDHSNDSRKWGTVRFDEMKGPAFILYWSWDVNGSFLQFLNPINWWSAEKRWGRIFKRVTCVPPKKGNGGPDSAGP